MFSLHEIRSLPFFLYYQCYWLCAFSMQRIFKSSDFSASTLSYYMNFFSLKWMWKTSLCWWVSGCKEYIVVPPCTISVLTFFTEQCASLCTRGALCLLLRSLLHTYNLNANLETREPVDNAETTDYHYWLGKRFACIKKMKLGWLVV